MRLLFAKLAMGSMFLNAMAFAFVSGLVSNTSFAANLYVSPAGSDSNSGTQAAPFKTIQKAASLATAGSTVHIAPGIYKEVISSKNNGTSMARIRYISDVKWGAKVLAVPGAYSIWEVSGAYTDVIGFEIDGSGSRDLRIGIGFSGGNSSLQNSHVHDIAMTAVCDNLGGAGVHASQSRGADFNNYDFIGNEIHHVGGICGYISAIYHQSSGNIKNNLVYASSYGIHLYHDDHDVNIVNNTVFGNSGYGILYGGCQEAYNMRCPTRGMRIYNNIVYDNGGGVSGPTSSTDVDNILKNNLVFKNTIQFDLASPSNSTRSGEVIADPEFVNYKRSGGGDYRLRSTSPAINRGLSALSPSTATATDLDGNLRNDGSVDIGAYEYGVSVTPAPSPNPTAAPVPSPILSLSAKTVVFSAQKVGARRSSQMIILKNVGNAPLIFPTGFVISGDFVLGGKSTCQTRVSYAPGSSCTLSIVFKPKAVGKRTGNLIIQSNASAASSIIKLFGTGL